MNPETFLTNLMSFPPISKMKAWHSDLWCDRVRLLPCCFHGCKEPSTIHHIFSKGHTGNWAHDFFGIPVCLKHHEEIQGLRSEEIILIWVATIILILDTTDLHIFEPNSLSEKPEWKKAKVASPKNIKPIFKDVKLGAIGLQYCPKCRKRSFAKEKIRHEETCRHFTENAQN